MWQKLEIMHHILVGKKETGKIDDVAKNKRKNKDATRRH